MAMPMPPGPVEHGASRGCRWNAPGVGRLLVAAAAVAAWLGATPATAQRGDAGAVAKGSAAGESATPPATNASERKQLLIVGSSSLEPVTDAVTEHLVREYVMPPPVKRFNGTETGFKDFCAGVGVDYPDIVAASHRMGRGELEICADNRVLDVTEVAIGQSALVAATRKGNPTFNLTPRMVYYAAAEDVPLKGDFAANPNKSWKDTQRSAPDLPIRLFIPAKGSGTRRFFDDAFMQGGCRHVKEIDAIFAAADRVPKCVTLRDDGPVTEVAEPFQTKVLDALADGAPGTIAILPWIVYVNNRDKLDALPVDGVVPTHENIAEYTYEMAITLHYYFKRAHMRNNTGRGVVRGIREFMAEIVKDEATGEGGYFEALGLVALGPEERRRQQEIVRRLKRFQP